MIRPNGKPYKPRKPPIAYYTENEGHSGPWGWVIVRRTHDVDLAFELGRRENEDISRDKYELTWMREGIENGESILIRDDVKGAATVIFEVSE